MRKGCGINITPTSILARRQDKAAGDDGVLEKVKSNVLVISAGFRIIDNAGKTLEMGCAVEVVDVSAGVMMIRR